MALTDKLTAIAEAIRDKTNSVEEMTLDQMPDKIREINTNGVMLESLGEQKASSDELAEGKKLYDDEGNVVEGNVSMWPSINWNSTWSSYDESQQKIILTGNITQRRFLEKGTKNATMRCQGKDFGDATIDDVLLGIKFTSINGLSKEGSMPNNGAIFQKIDGVNTTSFIIPKGYHNGFGTVSLDETIDNAVNDAKSALAAKGVTVPNNANITNLAGLIKQINQGGASGGNSSPTLTTLTVNPETTTQTITPSSGIDGYSKVIVNPVQTQTKRVTTNGTVRPDSGKFLTEVIVEVENPTQNEFLTLIDRTTRKEYVLYADNGNLMMEESSKFVDITLLDIPSLYVDNGELMMEVE